MSAVATALFKWGMFAGPMVASSRNLSSFTAASAFETSTMLLKFASMLYAPVFDRTTKAPVDDAETQRNMMGRSLLRAANSSTAVSMVRS